MQFSIEFRMSVTTNINVRSQRHCQCSRIFNFPHWSHEYLNSMQWMNGSGCDKFNSLCISLLSPIFDIYEWHLRQISWGYTSRTKKEESLAASLIDGVYGKKEWPHVHNLDRIIFRCLDMKNLPVLQGELGMKPKSTYMHVYGNVSHDDEGSNKDDEEKFKRRKEKKKFLSLHRLCRRQIYTYTTTSTTS